MLQQAAREAEDSSLFGSTAIVPKRKLDLMSGTETRDINLHLLARGGDQCRTKQQGGAR
jgi:hypothetical protein